MPYKVYRPKYFSVRALIAEKEAEKNLLIKKLSSLKNQDKDTQEIEIHIIELEKYINVKQATKETLQKQIIDEIIEDLLEHDADGLDLSGMSLTRADAFYIWQILCHIDINIRHLNLANNLMGIAFASENELEPSVDHLVSCFYHESLQSVNLTNNQINDKWVEECLAPALVGTNVQNLLLNDNKITDLGVNAIMPAICYSKLGYIELHDTLITEVTINKLGKVLKEELTIPEKQRPPNFYYRVASYEFLEGIHQSIEFSNNFTSQKNKKFKQKNKQEQKIQNPPMVFSMAAKKSTAKKAQRAKPNLENHQPLVKNGSKYSSCQL